MSQQLLAAAQTLACDELAVGQPLRSIDDNIVAQRQLLNAVTVDKVTWVQLLLQTPICCLLMLVAFAVCQHLLAAADEQQTSNSDPVTNCGCAAAAVFGTAVHCLSVSVALQWQRQTHWTTRTPARACSTGAVRRLDQPGVMISERALQRQLQLLAAAAWL